MADATAGKIPHVLVIMDGVGHREAIEDNAFLAANRPNLTAISLLYTVPTIVTIHRKITTNQADNTSLIWILSKQCI
jgi:bisphosphoglycerate-independent phosphoglycerate mutase (AlkP superfamily)